MVIYNSGLNEGEAIVFDFGPETGEIHDETVRFLIVDETDIEAMI